jgi:ATPase subunit of ABC transporter with duplicated ATPase domains
LLRARVPSLWPLQAARQEVQDKDILASQQEYRKGVSSWNFDVAALKAAAAAAREEEEERLPPISEYSGGSRRLLYLALTLLGAVAESLLLDGRHVQVGKRRGHLGSLPHCLTIIIGHNHTFLDALAVYPLLLLQRPAS